MCIDHRSESTRLIILTFLLSRQTMPVHIFTEVILRQSSEAGPTAAWGAMDSEGLRPRCPSICLFSCGPLLSSLPKLQSPFPLLLHLLKGPQESPDGVLGGWKGLSFLLYPTHWACSVSNQIPTLYVCIPKSPSRLFQIKVAFLLKLTSRATPTAAFSPHPACLLS